MVVNKSQKCSICGKGEVLESRELKNYWFCASCGTYRIKRKTKVEYGEEYYEGNSGLATKLFEPISLFFYKIRSSYAKPGKKNIWVDVGAGEGKFLKAVNAKDKVGVEISLVGRKYMEKMGITTLSPSVYLNKKRMNADVISFWHVLEHVDNPGEYLLSAKRNLAPGGEIIIGIPNSDGLEFKFFREKWFHFAPDYHLWLFSLKGMKSLLKQLGFKIIRVDYWSPEHHLPGILQSFINATSGSENILHKLVKRGTDISNFSFEDIFWIIFWLTLGLPIVLIFWVLNSLLHKSGTVVIVAYK